MLVVKLMSSSGDTGVRDILLGSGWAWVMCSLAALWLVAPVVFLAASDASQGMLFLGMSALASFQLVSAFQLALIESAGRFDIAARSLLLGPLVVLSVLLVSLLWQIPFSALSYVSVLCIGALIDLGLAWLARRSLLQLGFVGLPRSPVWKSLWDLLKSGSLLQATSLMNMFLEPFNKMLLSSFLGGAAVTVYDLCMKLIWGIQSLFSAAMRVFLHIASQDKQQLESSYLSAIRLIVVPAVLLHVLACLFLVALTRYWLPLDSSELVIFFAVATLSNIGMIVVTPLYNGLIGTDDMRFIFKTQAALAVTNVVLSLLLIPLLGVLGAAFGLLLATLYNATAILRKGRNLTGNLRLTEFVFRSLGSRLPWAFALFGMAAYCSFDPGVAIPLGLAVLICTLIVLSREPVSVYLFSALKQKAHPAGHHKNVSQKP
jgi:O-antigen/teichoic acid export membrane protein